MTWAADAAGNPSPQALKDSGALFVGRYVGTQFQHFGVSRSYIDDCLAVGVGVLLIFEEWSSQFLGGYDVGRQMMNRMHDGWRALGAPDTIVPAVALVDPNPGAVPGNEQALIDFARGVNDGCWLPEWTGYGSKYGLDVVRNSGVATKQTRRWGVGTWGFGESPSGQLPANVDADMIQHGNISAPVPGVDYNTVLRDMGHWGEDVPLSEDDINRITLPLIQWMQNHVTGLGVDGKTEITNRAILDPVLALKGGVGGAGLTADEVKAIVRAELDRTKLGT